MEEVIGEEGILIDIFCRLPVKCLLRCKSVCKRWRYLISDPRFAHSHIRRSLEGNPKPCHRLLWLGHPIRSIDCDNLSCSPAAAGGNAIRYVEYPSAIPPGSFIEVVGSCNGLVCLIVSFTRFILWNPCTGAACDEMSDPARNLSGQNFFYGFGYDALTDDYKLLRGSSIDYYGSQYGRTVVDLFLWRTRSWRRKMFCDVPRITMKGHFLNGSLHWLASKYDGNSSRMIVSFDVASEMFGGLMCPLLDDGETPLEGLMTVDGCLFAYRNVNTLRDRFTFEGWLLTDYEVKSSWTKLCSFSIENRPAFLNICKPVWFKDSKVVFDPGNEELIVVERDRGTGDRLKICEFSLYSDYQSYVESLVSPSLDSGVVACPSGISR